ncbi:MAG TPA: hypothetical protein VM095_02690 [Pyrinomonadaceae bacterium]|nr:hypothetical protein [Pyrinomonadaceae bacterium]
MRHTLASYALVLMLLLVNQACSSSNIATPSTNSNTAPSVSNTKVDSSSNTGSSVSTTKIDSSTPTSTFISYNKARINKDPEGVKQTITKQSWENGEGVSNNSTPPRTFAEDIRNSRIYGGPTIPKMRNEKIDGDTATLEMYDDELNDWYVVPFIKEDGQWKIALYEIHRADK